MNGVKRAGNYLILIVLVLIFVIFIEGCSKGKVEPKELKIQNVHYEEGNYDIPNEGKIYPVSGSNYTIVLRLTHDDSPFTVNYLINGGLYAPSGEQLVFTEEDDEDPEDYVFQHTIVRNIGDDVEDIVIYLYNENADTDTFHFTAIASEFQPGMEITPSDTYYHDNSTDTVEVYVKDSTDPSFYYFYDKLELWLNNELYATGSPGQNFAISDTSELVGDIPLELRFYDGSNLLASKTATLHGLNNPPDHPECDDDDDFFQDDAGNPISYWLVKHDDDGDPLTLETNYGIIDPDDVIIVEEKYPSGTYWYVYIDTTGWQSGTYGIHHKAKDNHGAESTWEDIDIKIN